MPERNWLRRLSLVLALLLTVARNTKGNPLNISSHDPYKGAATNSNVQYELIDVAANSNINDNKLNGILNTGETTRFYTTGEVDDNFWLKHLGEDFKRAIHLQVDDNNNPYVDGGNSGDRVGGGNGVYNLTHNGNQVNVEHDYSAFGIANRNPVQRDSEHHFSSASSQQQQQQQQEQQQRLNINYPTESSAESHGQTTEAPVPTTTTSGDFDGAQNQNSSETIRFTIVKNNNNKNATTQPEETADGQKKQNDVVDMDPAKKGIKRRNSGESQEESAAPSSYERVFALDDSEYFTRSFKKKTNRKLKKIPNLHKRQKNTPSDIDTNTNTNTNDNSNSNTNSQTPAKEKRKKTQRSQNRYSYTPPPIVINLPDNQNTVHQLDDSDTPVVVKMPPIIYHQSAMRTEERDDQDRDGAHTHEQQPQDQPQEYNDNTNMNTNTNTKTKLNTNTNIDTHTEHKSYTTHYTSPEQKPHYHQQSDADDKRQFSAYMRNHFNAAPYADDTAGSFRYVMPKAENSNSFRKVEQDLSSYDTAASYGNDDVYSRSSRSNQQDIFDKGL